MTCLPQLACLWQDRLEGTQRKNLSSKPNYKGAYPQRSNGVESGART
jgi:hypothetical protein